MIQLQKLELVFRNTENGTRKDRQTWGLKYLFRLPDYELNRIKNYGSFTNSQLFGFSTFLLPKLYFKKSPKGTEITWGQSLNFKIYLTTNFLEFKSQEGKVPRTWLHFTHKPSSFDSFYYRQRSANVKVTLSEFVISKISLLWILHHNFNLYNCPSFCLTAYVGNIHGSKCLIRPLLKLGRPGEARIPDQFKRVDFHVDWWGTLFWTL